MYKVCTNFDVFEFRKRMNRRCLKKLYHIMYYTGCRKINVFQVGGLAGKNLKNLEKIK
jgi:hypothetical protein